MSWKDKYPEIDVLLGKTMSKVEKKGDEIIFETECGGRFRMYHRQDCCEHVSIEDICGDLEDLIGSPILVAEERTNSDQPKDRYADSFTWTFYELATNKGSVTIRWYGTSNGYYSEGVDLENLNHTRW